jgi:hypothetical protein
MGRRSTCSEPQVFTQKSRLSYFTDAAFKRGAAGRGARFFPDCPAGQLVDDLAAGLASGKREEVDGAERLRQHQQAHGDLSGSPRPARSWAFASPHNSLTSRGGFMRTGRTGFALSLGSELGPPGDLTLDLLPTPSRRSSEASNDFIRVIRPTSEIASARSRPLAHPLPLDRQTLRTQGATLFAPRDLAAAHTHPLSVPPEFPPLLSCHLHQVLLSESRHWLQYVHVSWVGHRVGSVGSVGPDLPPQRKLVRAPRAGPAWSRPSPG